MTVDRIEQPQPSNHDEKSPAPGFAVTDKRFWVLKQQQGGKSDGADMASDFEKRYPTYVEQLLSQLKEKDDRLQEYISSYKRLKNENEEYLQRVKRDLEKRLEMAKLELFVGLLEILDNLERAMEAAEIQRNPVALLEGIKLVGLQFVNHLKGQGVEEVAALGHPFDPKQQEAVEVMAVETPEQDNVVLSVIEKGYQLGDRLIRPAKVRVGHWGKPRDTTAGHPDAGHSVAKAGDIEAP